MAFLRRAERLLAAAEPARLDYPLLVAALAARREAGEGARPGAVAPCRPAAAEAHPLTELLLGGPRWREAVSAQRGCFSRAEAGRRVNGA